MPQLVTKERLIKKYKRSLYSTISHTLLATITTAAVINYHKDLFLLCFLLVVCILNIVLGSISTWKHWKHLKTSFPD